MTCKKKKRYTTGWPHLALFLPGSFGEAGAQTDQYVEWLREYCQAFFYGLSVKLLPAVTVAETGCSFRINSNSHNLQILTGKSGSPLLLPKAGIHWIISIGGLATCHVEMIEYEG